MKNGTNPNPLRAQHAAGRMWLRLLEAAAIRRAPAPELTIHPDGTVKARFVGPDAVVALNVWREAIPAAAMSTVRAAGGLEYELTIVQGDVSVTISAYAPYRVTAPVAVTA
ncbi:hypothetical protein GCM10009639_52170 [Kitasatospora putterlickiae]|uniref:Uncharacterized protein n=1 Tax=Kitasatospora putterlickiae TaxID=221725 RepID=A0ABP4J5F9_9ACTN